MRYWLLRRRVPTLPTSSSEPQGDLQLQIAHLLLIDVVGYSKLLVNEQIETVQELARIVRGTECFRQAEAKQKLIRVPTGDGMALLFFHSPEEPVRCALEIAKQLRENPVLQVRMGIHSGPVNQVRDVNDQLNVVGGGMNVAQRVLDCGDAGHILLSKHVADDLEQYRHWQPFLRDLGECEVKHGLRLHIVSLCKDGIGNPALPQKLRRGARWRQSSASVRRVRSSRVPPIFVACVSLAIVGLAVTSVLSLRRPPVVPKPEILGKVLDKSIAVLPFENLSDDKQNAYFSDGVHDEILNGLSRVADIKVISRTSVMQYRAAGTRNLREIARTLGVAHIVEGTVQRAGNRVRVSAQLINAQTDMHVWGEHYDRDVADVFALESELAEKIVGQLKATLSPQEKAAIEERPTKDMAAYDLYVRAKNLIDQIAITPQAKENLVEAIGLLDKAVTRDPSFLRAYYYLARAHDVLYFLGFDHTPARLELAQKAVDAALKLRPTSGEAHLALAQHLYSGYRDYERARKELALAQGALPNEPLVFVLTGMIDRRQGRWDDAVKDWQHASELDPRNIDMYQQLYFTYESLRRFDEAERSLERILAIAPDNIDAQLSRAYIHFQSLGDMSDSRRLLETMTKDPNLSSKISAFWLDVAMADHDPVAAERALTYLPQDGCAHAAIPFPRAWCEGLVFRLRGNNEAARDAFLRARGELKKILDQQPDYPEALCALGMVDAALGNKKDAIQEGRRSVELCPLSKDSIEGAILLQYLSVIYAWTGEKQLALEQVALIVRIPSGASYGELQKDWEWDPLRGDKRFEKIVASLAPAAKKP